MSWQDEAAEINEALHKALGCKRVCTTACTHFLNGSWSLAGLADVAARNGRRSLRQRPEITGGDA